MLTREFVDGTTVLTRHKAKRTSNTGHTGIFHTDKPNTYHVQVHSRNIGYRTVLADAIALRDEARRRWEDGSFAEWYAGIVQARADKRKK